MSLRNGLKNACSSKLAKATRWISLLILVGALALTGNGHADEPVKPNWDPRSDTWVATDQLGRVLPTHDQVGPPRMNRTVDMFYFLWLGRHGEAGPFDISKILRASPEAIKDPLDPMDEAFTTEVNRHRHRSRWIYPVKTLLSSGSGLAVWIRLSFS